MNSEQMIARIDQLKQARSRLLEQIHSVIVGQDRVIDDVLTGLFANGHMLIEGVPGLAKTLLISTIAKALNLSFGRIQFTPDLMPSDITGSDILVGSGSGHHGRCRRLIRGRSRERRQEWHGRRLWKTQVKIIRLGVGGVGAGKRRGALRVGRLYGGAGPSDQQRQRGAHHDGQPKAKTRQPGGTDAAQPGIRTEPRLRLVKKARRYGQRREWREARQHRREEIRAETRHRQYQGSDPEVGGQHESRPRQSPKQESAQSGLPTQRPGQQRLGRAGDRDAHHGERRGGQQ